MRRWRTLLVGALLPLLLAGCGADPKPQKIEPETDQAPADLCATVPTSVRQGLVSDTSSSTGSSPTAACSLRSPVGTAQPVRVLVTWLVMDDSAAAADVLASQCRSFDRLVYRVETGFSARGADRGCAASGGTGGQGSATLAATTGRQVVVVRWDGPGSASSALAKGRQTLEGVLGSLGGSGS